MWQGKKGSGENNTVLTKHLNSKCLENKLVLLYRRDIKDESYGRNNAIFSASLSPAHSFLPRKIKIKEKSGTDFFHLIYLLKKKKKSCSNQHAATSIFIE